MVRILFISSALLWVNVISFNLPYCWDPITGTWRINQSPEPSVLYIMPESPQHVNESPIGSPFPDSTCTDKCNTNRKCNRPKNNYDCCVGQDLIVIDTDCDVDDAIAMGMIINGARSRPGSTVAGITCTWGCTGIRNVTNNVIKTLKALDQLGEIPVYAGADSGLVGRKNWISPYGYDAFGDFYCFLDIEEQNIVDEHPAIFIANLVRENPGRVTIACMGPLCNIVLASHLYSDFYKDVKQIYYMGSSMNGTVPVDDAVICDYMDPYAAMAVFNREVDDADTGPNKITIFPHELTVDSHFTWEWRDTVLGKKGTRFTNLLNYAESKRSREDQEWHIYSAHMAAAFLEPEIIAKELYGRPSVLPSGIMEISSGEVTEENRHNVVRVIQKIIIEKVQKLMITLL